MKLDLKHFELDLGSAWNGKLKTTPLEKAWTTFRKKSESQKIGFYDWPVQFPALELAALKRRAEEIKKTFEGVVIFGIGGSYLGPWAITQALGGGSFPTHWVSNTDEPAMARARQFVRKYRSAAVVISKSGNTTETLSAFYHLSKDLNPKGYTIITDPKSGELRRLVDRYGWESFAISPNIGGRFSVLTAVGCLPLFLEGIDAKAVLQGAIEMRESLEKTPAKKNPACLFAMLCWHWNQKGKNLHYLMPYQADLKSLTDWFVQLFAESLGKEKKGFTPVTALGTSDQHSLLQLFKEGPGDKVIGFMDVYGAGGCLVGKPAFETGEFGFLCKHTFEKVNHLALEATQKSLSHLPSYRFRFPEITAKALGAWMFLMETACAVAGELYGVDAFNQPGVEEAKKLLRKSL
jgi:glucose-6-phosphate isomerase